ncbi:hypothetical protein NP233_g8888 [Leucocoprinus birnbaumii]|uniref:Uncharacterized protein n=1 Tax=Leucocoprinus birnbaumii TaxID=56174 RepID=A0AAD5VM47_9AGAR|nr:hypothetical protein NP233_g8888 [Leucocoprinus birnbaumii]
MSAKVTVQDALSEAELLLKPRVAALVLSTSSLQAGDGVDKALQIHTDAVLVKEGKEKLLPYVINIQHPVSVADANMVLAFTKDILNSCVIVIENAIEKKELFDALPVGNITKLIAQDLKMNYEAMLTLTSALLDAAPAEAIAEGKEIKKGFEDAFMEVIGIYQ